MKWALIRAITPQFEHLMFGSSRLSFGLCKSNFINNYWNWNLLPIFLPNILFPPYSLFSYPLILLLTEAFCIPFFPQHSLFFFSYSLFSLPYFPFPIPYFPFFIPFFPFPIFPSLFPIFPFPIPHFPVPYSLWPKKVAHFPTPIYTLWLSP